MSNVNERILLIIKHFCEGNKAEFARTMGEKSQTINGWLKRNNGTSVLNKILSKYPTISPSWLYTGEGEMLNDQQPEKVKIKLSLSEAMKAQEKEEINNQWANVKHQIVNRYLTPPTTSPKAVVERLKVAVPEAKNVRSSIILQHLFETNPTKALWVATGNDDKVVVDKLEMEALVGQIKALKMLNESQSKEIEALRAQSIGKAKHF